MVIEIVAIWMIRIFGLLSFLSCLCVVSETLAEWKANKVILRIQFWLQIPLLVFASQHLLPCSSSPDLGQIQGALSQFAMVGSMLMDLSLSACYLLMLDCKWQENHLKTFTKYVHIVVWPCAVIPSIYLLVERQYNPAVGICWFGEVALGQASTITRDTVYILCVLHVIFSWYIMCRIYKFAVANSSDDRSKVLARKGFMYAASVTLLQTPILSWTVIRLSFGIENKGFTDLSGTAVPLAGFLNLLAFMWNRRNPKTRYGRVVRRIIDYFAVREREMHEDSETQSAIAAGRDLFLTTESGVKDLEENTTE